MVDIRWTSPEGERMRIRRVSPIQNKRAAHEYERELLRELANGSFKKKKQQPATEVPFLRDWIREFIAVYATTNNKHTEVKSKESICRNHLIPAMGHFRLDRIGKPQIERYKAIKVSQGLAAKTINNHLTVLRKMLVVAHEWDLIDFVPHIQWLKTVPPDFDFLDFDEAERLFASADGKWRPMILFAARTGLRLGELRGLTWRNVDLQRGRVTVMQSYVRGRIGPTKNNRVRTIPVSGETLSTLKEHRKRSGSFVFGNGNGDPVAAMTSRRALHRACGAAELRQIGWHTLRHSFASHLVMKGVPLKVVQELMGHATIEMTMRYAHLAPSALDDAIERLEGTYRARDEMALDN
jgi:integrase